VKFVEAVHLFGTADGLSKLELYEASDHSIPEKQTNKERGQSRTESPEGDVLEDIQDLNEMNPLEE
jgi:hypothetical protein